MIDIEFLILLILRLVEKSEKNADFLLNAFILKYC